MRCCVAPCGQTYSRLTTKKHFLPIGVLLNVRIDPDFTQNFFFSFLALFTEKFRFPAKTPTA